MKSKDFRAMFLRNSYLLCAIAFASTNRSLYAHAQTVSADLGFEVATVKPVDPSSHFDGRHFGAHVTQSGVSYWHMTTAYLVEHAYDLQLPQVVGPEWTTHDYFDVEAKFSDGTGEKDERRLLQTLLSDRFKLSFHIEKKVLDGYVLVVGKHGAKLQHSHPNPAMSTAEAFVDEKDRLTGKGHPNPTVIKNLDGSSTVNMGERGTQTVRFDREKSAMHFERSRISMAELALDLSSCVGREAPDIVDETGIKGTYQLQWDCPNPELPRRAGSDATGILPPDPEGGFWLSKSLDALGLKLEKRKIPMDVYIIDHVEKPSEN